MKYLVNANSRPFKHGLKLLPVKTTNELKSGIVNPHSWKKHTKIYSLKTKVSFLELSEQDLELQKQHCKHYC